MMQRARVAILLACALALSACADINAPLRRPNAPPPDPHTQMVALESRIFDLVETERLKIDPSAKTLRLDSELVGVARAKSQDMATKNYLLHKAPDGETTADIIMDKDTDFQGLLGENIAADGYDAKYGVDVDAYAKAIVNTWLNSADHKQNLSYAAYDRTGIGAAVNGNMVYVTQLFATDLGLPPPDQQHAAPRAMQQFTDPKSAAHASKPPPGASTITPTAKPN
jgi:uncharacterized protein YkwD